MRVAVACDHGGFALKDTILAVVRAEGHEPVDLGATSAESSDYPDFAKKIGRSILSGERSVEFLSAGQASEPVSRQIKSRASMQVSAMTRILLTRRSSTTR